MDISILKHSLTPFFVMILTLTACSGVSIQTSSNTKLEKGDYHGYRFKTAALPNDGRWTDAIYRLDPAIRSAIEEGLQRKGYVADEKAADFTVGYTYAPGYISGVEPENSDTLSPTPQVRNLRPTDQASVDNAIALAGVKQTTDINITLFDSISSDTLWTATVSMIVENANNRGGAKAQRKISKVVKRALGELPAVQ